MWTNCTSRGLIPRPFNPNFPPFDISTEPRTPTNHQPVFFPYDLRPCSIDKSEICTLLIFLTTKRCVFLFMTRKETSQSCWSAQTLDANLSEVPVPQSLTFFLILWVRVFDFTWSFLICYLTLWACACACHACLCERRWRIENVSTRVTVYLCVYLFE